MTVLMFLLTAMGAPPPTVEELVLAVDDLHQGRSSKSVWTLQVKAGSFQQTLVIDALTLGTEHALLTITAPDDEAGQRILRLGDDLWTFHPALDRTIAMSANRMEGTWMGSHFTNAELVHRSRLSEDYTPTLVSAPGPEQPDAHHVIALAPREPGPWSRVELTLSRDRLPLSIRYFDGQNALKRTLTYTDVQPHGKRQIPTTLELTLTDRPGESTRITLDALVLDAPVSAKLFTLQALKSTR